MNRKDVKLGAIVQHTGNDRLFTVVNDTRNSVAAAPETILGELAEVNKEMRLKSEIVPVADCIFIRSLGGYKLVWPGDGKLLKGIRIESRTKSEYYTVAIRTDDPERKHCNCKICAYGREISKLAERQNTLEDRAMVEKLYDRMSCADEDAAYWRIRDHGGFEAVEKTDFHKKHVKKYSERKKE